MKEQPSGDTNNQRKDGLDRRSFVRGVTSTLIAQAVFAGAVETGARTPEIQNFLKERSRRMRFDRWHSLSAKEREERIEAEATEYGTLVRSPEGQRILERGTDEEIWALLRLVPPVLREHIVRTKYDIPKEKWPSVAIRSSFVPDLPVFKTLAGTPRKEMEATYGGNGVFVDERTLLTNWHVIKKQAESSDAPMPQILSFGYKQGIDVAYVRLPEEHLDGDEISLKLKDLAEKHGTFPLASLSDTDLNGRFVAVAGIDPDESAAEDGTKIYPSVAIRVTKRLSIFLQKYNSLGERAYEDPTLENSFLYFAPPGESIWRRLPSRTGSRALDELLGQTPSGRYTLLHGMSGSPVMMNGQLVGLNCLVSEVSFRGQSFDVGLFHGPDILRKAKDAGMEWKMPGKGQDSYSDSSSEGFGYDDGIEPSQF